MYEYILFDLDGTLTDPKDGIVNSILHSLKYYPHITAPSRDELCDFIGPPLANSYMRRFGMDAEVAAEAVEHYREYFRDIGIFENELYPGVSELLSELCANGKKPILATSKPELFAKKILQHFGISEYFTYTCGSMLDGSFVEKKDIIAKIVEELPGIDKSNTVMVGDRSFDVIGAKTNGIRCIGVTYGYGSGKELLDAGAFAIVKSVDELHTLLLPDHTK